MRTDTHDRTQTTGRPWLPLGLGVAGLLAIPVLGRVLRMVMQGQGALGMSPSQLGVAVAIVLSVAGLVTGIRALARHERSWPVWTGTVFSGLVALFWSTFALGEILFPH